MATATHDHVEVRCPILGHVMTFGSCRTREAGMPCGNTLECYGALLPAGDQLRRSLGAQAYARAFTGDGPRQSRLRLEEVLRGRVKAV